MSTIKTNDDTDDLCESWVNIATPNSLQDGGGGSGTPPFSTIPQQFSTVENYLRLLKEAQETSSSSGSRCRDSPRSASSSPKSPPNSPIENYTPPYNLDWNNSYYINSINKGSSITDGKEDWSSRPDSVPPKPWSFRASNPPTYDNLSLRYAKIGETPLFSKRGLYIVLITNLFSLLMGAGVGLFVFKHGRLLSASAVKLR